MLLRMFKHNMDSWMISDFEHKGARCLEVYFRI